jgi:hypothetical protein
MGVLLRVVCWLVGHRWHRGPHSFGHTLWSCGRCGTLRYRRIEYVPPADLAVMRGAAARGPLRGG